MPKRAHQGRIFANEETKKLKHLPSDKLNKTIGRKTADVCISCQIGAEGVWGNF